MQLTLGNVCIVVEARAGAKGCVFLVRADSAVINNTRNASVTTVALAYPHYKNLHLSIGAYIAD